MPAIHVFIDTNVLLNFYSFTEDTSSDLETLTKLLSPEQINVHLPKQVEDEFWRNRESKIHTAVAEFNGAKPPPGIPNHMRGTDTAKQYKEALDVAASARKKLAAHVLGLAVLEELEIDNRVQALFSTAVRHNDCEASLCRAITRMHKGNPPGKPGNIGDRYNWEILLASVPDADLHIVTNDMDFTTLLGAVGKAYPPMPFLVKEWRAKAPGRNLYVYSTIQALLSYYEKLVDQPVEVPVQVQAALEEVAAAAPAVPAAEDDALAVDPELEEAKVKAINQLVHSDSFYTTHKAIAKLGKLIPLITVQDAEELFNAATDNQQISWIITDPDVRSFYVTILNMHFVDAESGLVDLMIDLLGLQADEEIDDEGEAQP
ncbi:PIN domain-containing protein [Stenotrophomonas sp. GZD-301]|uniref:PIN domain-containing protein n=1 Tax=Stenotrophomonas sp. GZD-301 TaxID=3404814 RepID=UPI003BB5D658